MSPRAGRGLLVVGLLALLTVTGCAARDAAPTTVAPPGAGTAPPAASSSVLDAFVDANGLGMLPRGVVRIERSGAVGALLDVEVVVAATAESQARGLMGVADVPDGVGMLFVFPAPAGSAGRPGFWMLDTLVPLDIAFAEGGVVVGVATMEPCRERPCPITHPGVDYDVALEVAAGVLSAAGVSQGDRLTWVPAG